MSDLENNPAPPSKILPSNIEKMGLVRCEGVWDLNGDKREGCGAYSDFPDICSGSSTATHIRSNLFKVKGKWFSLKAGLRDALISIVEIDDAVCGSIYRPKLTHVTCWSELVSELKLMGISDEECLRGIPVDTFSRIRGGVLRRILDHNSNG